MGGLGGGGPLVLVKLDDSLLHLVLGPRLLGAATVSVGTKVTWVLLVSLWNGRELVM